MEGKCRLTFNGRKIYIDYTVVICNSIGGEGRIIAASAVYLKILLCLVISYPDRGETGGLCGHNVNTASVVHRETGNTVADELKHLILNKAVCKYRTDKCDRYVLRTYTAAGSTVKVYCNNSGTVNIVGAAEKLLNYLRTALTDSHGTESTVTGVAVRAEYHFAAACEHLTHKCVDDSLVGGYVYTAVFLCGGKTEYVVILIDGSANGAKAVMAVGENVRNRDFLKTGCACGLNYTYIGNIVRCKSIEFDPELFLA